MVFNIPTDIIKYYPNLINSDELYVYHLFKGVNTTNFANFYKNKNECWKYSYMFKMKLNIELPLNMEYIEKVVKYIDILVKKYGKNTYNVYSKIIKNYLYNIKTGNYFHMQKFGIQNHTKLPLYTNKYLFDLFLYVKDIIEDINKNKTHKKYSKWKLIYMNKNDIIKLKCIKI